MLLVELGATMSFRHPSLVTIEDVDRIRDANNVLLVTSRVLMGIAKRAGLSSDDVAGIVARSQWVPRKQDVMDTAADSPEEGKITGRATRFEVITAVDEALADPSIRGSLPDWFIFCFWPPALRRVAGGGHLTDRECEVAMHVISVAGGER